MAWSWTPERRDAPELMDAPGLPDAEVEDAYRILRRVNRQLGNLGTLRVEFRRFLAEVGPDAAPLSILDVGSGSGDIPLDLKGRAPGRLAGVLALDRDPTAVLASRRRGLLAIRGDALRLPFEDRSIDLVTAIKFAHHFHGPSLPLLSPRWPGWPAAGSSSSTSAATSLAYWGFRAWSLAFTRNRLVRHDGPLSVLRGFTADELIAASAPIPGYSWEIRPYLGFQLALVGRRRDIAP